jgi:hypothetical protein
MTESASEAERCRGEASNANVKKSAKLQRGVTHISLDGWAVAMVVTARAVDVGRCGRGAAKAGVCVRIRCASRRGLAARKSDSLENVARRDMQRTFTEWHGKERAGGGWREGGVAENHGSASADSVRQRWLG